MKGPYRKIACCVEHDGMAEEVVREGLRAARGDASVLRLVHVVAPPHPFTIGFGTYVPPAIESRADAREWLDKLAEATPGAVPVVLQGMPAREVEHWAGDKGVDLIVMAARRGRIERAMSGGFAAHLAYHAPCPLLILPRLAGSESADEGAREADAAPS